MAEIFVNITHHHPCSIQQNFVCDRPSNPSSHCRLYLLKKVPTSITLLPISEHCCRPDRTVGLLVLILYALNETIIEENKEKRERFCDQISSLYIDQS